MRQQNPTNITRRGSSNVVKVPTTSQFAGDSILNVSIEKIAETGAPTGAFPIALFGPAHEVANYSAINSRLPNGYTLDGITRNDDGSVEFKYDDSTNDITLKVSSNTLPYQSIVRSLLQNYVKVSTTRMTVSPAGNANVQFGENILTAYKSMFGGVKENMLEVDINQKPSDFRNDIVDIPQKIDLDINNVLVVYFDASTDKITLSMASSTYQVGKNNL